MRYVVVRTVERTLTFVGQSNNKKDAFLIMKKDFEHFFWDKIGYCSDVSFDDAYAAYCFNDYNIAADTAFLNDCNGYDYDWGILDTQERKNSKASLPTRCWSLPMATK